MALLPESERRDFFRSLSDHEVAALEYDWQFWSRPDQRPPDTSWLVWLALAGRGWGKTRVGAEWIRDEVESGRRSRLALVGETAADGRDVMVEGESGLLAVCPPWNRPKYEPSKRRVTWTNGAFATVYSADDPEQLRGPQHDGAWADEIGKWKHGEDTWSNLLFGLRLGKDPRAVATSTPRPIPLVKLLVKDPSTAVTKGTTYDNLMNLAANFRSVILRYEGTRLGRQELSGELLDDVEGALWTLGLIDNARWKKVLWGDAPDLQRVVVAIDPAGTAGKNSDETGIVAAGAAECRCKGYVEVHFFVVDDRSGKRSPNGWGEAAVSLYRALHADRIVGETNNGGDMVENTIRTVDKGVSYRGVHASRGKMVRAEPIAALYEQGKVHHVGLFPELEDQMTQYVPLSSGDKSSPDRMDALVWALTDLSENGQIYVAPVSTIPDEERHRPAMRGIRKKEF